MRCLLAVLGTMLASCGDPAAPAIEPTDTSSHDRSGRVTKLLSDVPLVDTSRHSVPLDEIYFNTFKPTDVLICPSKTPQLARLSKASHELIVALRDRIHPIYSPKVETVSDADRWLLKGDLVLGYVDGDAAFAYPAKILIWHEIVNHKVNGRPIVATY